jgi:hypothetical protein
MTLGEIGQALGWMGGILFLVDLAERKIRSSYWMLERSQKRYERVMAAQPPAPMPVLPPVHTFACTLCGERVSTFIYGCSHPDAPTHEPARVPVPIPMPSVEDPP